MMSNSIKTCFPFLLGLMLPLFAMAQSYDFVVAKDGSGDFKTVQEAINAVPDFRKNRTTIYIKNGTYKEKLVLPASKTAVTFIGQDVEKTILTHDDYASKKNTFGEEMGTTGSTSFYIFGDDFTARNITFENSAGPVGQAVAVRIDGDKVMFENCRFLGFQDTLYPHGRQSRQYYKNCYIEGTTDYIFGSATAVFENCVIHSKANTFITAASTPEGAEFGFVFLNTLQPLQRKKGLPMDLFLETARLPETLLRAVITWAGHGGRMRRRFLSIAIWIK